MGEERLTWCGLYHARCGLVMEFETGKPVGLRGDREHPTNRGATCSRGRMMLEHMFHLDRLNVPLRSAGARGTHACEEVSREEALDDIARRLSALRHEHGTETLAQARLKPMGISFDDLVRERRRAFPDEVGRFRRQDFATDTGKVELFPDFLRDHGMKQLPEPRLDHLPREHTTLLAITGSAFNPMFHSEQRQWPTARAQRPDPECCLSPLDAERLSIESGQWVRITSTHGTIRQKAGVTHRIRHGVVDCQHG